MEDDAKLAVREAIVEAGKAYKERGFAAPVNNFKKVYESLESALSVEPGQLAAYWAGNSATLGNRRNQAHGKLKGKRCELLLLVVPPDVVDAALTEVQNHPEWGGVTSQLLLASSPVKPTNVSQVEIVKKFAFPVSSPGGSPATGIPSETAIITPDWFQDLQEALRLYKNVLIEGVPGTGKTHVVRLISGIHDGRSLGATGDAWAAMTLHPSVSYEDFIEGLRPSSHEDTTFEDDFEAAATIRVDRKDLRWFFSKVPSGGDFRVVDGFFLRICTRAAADPDRDFVVLLDELNRANVPRVIGDLLTTLEASRRATWDHAGDRWDTRHAQLVTLPYSGRTLFVPDNVYVIATVNGTDRSLAPLDDAIRRRFASLRAEPLELDSVKAQVPEFLWASLDVWADLNETVLRPALGPNGVLGHSYFFQMASHSAGPEIAVRLGWRYALLAQVCSLAERTGSEELFAGSGDVRRSWISRHGVVGDESALLETLERFDKFLQELGLKLSIEGTGLERRLMVNEHVE